MRLILRILKKIWLLNFLRRIYYAGKYYNKRYVQILKWGLQSKETTNYTYDLTDTNIIYLAHTISVVTGEPYEKVLAYMNEARKNEELKQYIIDTTKKLSERKFADLEVFFGRRLGWYAIVRILKPKMVVETGVDKGLGSVLLCSALLKNRDEGFEGKYIGTDINPKAGYLLEGEYERVGRIMYGDSIESLAHLEGDIDILINDSDHSAEYEYNEYMTIKDRLTEKSIILGDNAHYTNKLALFSLETNRAFLFFQESPKNHWYPGAGIGISYKKQ